MPALILLDNTVLSNLALVGRHHLLTLAQANALWTEMIAAGYRSPVEVLETLM